jgi:hypothetical protein
LTTQTTGTTGGSPTSPKNGLKNTAFWNVMICGRDKIKQKNKIKRRYCKKHNKPGVLKMGV